MAKFVIAPHMRLHEWVARDKGYFEREGLEYQFSEQLTSPDGKLHDLGDKVGAYQTFERGRSSNINCACHWTVNVAASVVNCLVPRITFGLRTCSGSRRRERVSSTPPRLSSRPRGSRWHAWCSRQDWS
jgi:hypothetical protein